MQFWGIAGLACANHDLSHGSVSSLSFNWLVLLEYEMLISVIMTHLVQTFQSFIKYEGIT
jgi:hypothetical protein